MNTRQFNPITSFSFLLITSLNPTLGLATPMPLEHYIENVQKQNAGYQSSVKSAEAYDSTSSDYDLATSTQLFSTLSYTSNGGPSTNFLLTYDRMNTLQFNLGAQKLFPTGTLLKAYYVFSSIGYSNAGVILPSSIFPAAASSALTATTYLGIPTIEVTQSLWKNFFGIGTRAERTAVESQNLAQSYVAKFQAKSMVVQAEAAYYRLLLARQTLDISTQGLDRAQKIFEWNSRRVSLNLADRGDALQSEAAVKLRTLELQSAKDEERSASLAFNAMRGMNSSDVSEELDSTLLNKLDRISLPKRAEYRDDVKAAIEMDKASQASAKVNLEKSTPTLELFGNVSNTGYKTAFGDALGDSFAMSRITGAVGVRFMAPLDFWAVAKSREGWNKQALAASLNLDRKKFEQELSWNDLEQKFSEAKRRLLLVKSVESIQESRLENERRRLSQARTIMLQVLMAESDYLASQLNRIRSQAEVLTLASQMKLFGEDNQ